MKLATTMLVFCVGALLALGMVTLYSSRMGQRGEHFLVLQLAWCALGLIACVIAAGLDYRWFQKGWWLLLGIAIFLLVLVLIPGIGLKINGARRWIGVGDFRLQPSELAKLALIVFLAWYGDRYRRKMTTFTWGLAIPGFVIGLVLALIFVERDRGCTIFLGAVCVAMLLLAGVRWRYLLPPALLGAAGMAYVIWRDPVRFNRVLAWYNPELYKETSGYQQWQAILAFGSGGWDGLGLGNGRQKLGFVPEHHTDFILPVVGEEMGLVGTLMVVAAFIILVLCGAYIAWQAREPFGFLLGAGLTAMIGLQAFINIGVVTSLLPNKGLPLPFISYGGSNLLIMLTSVGFLLSIARHSGESVEVEPMPLESGEIAANPIT